MAGRANLGLGLVGVGPLWALVYSGLVVQERGSLICGCIALNYHMMFLGNGEVEVW